MKTRKISVSRKKYALYIKDNPGSTITMITSFMNNGIYCREKEKGVKYILNAMVKNCHIEKKQVRAVAFYYPGKNFDVILNSEPTTEIVDGKRRKVIKDKLFDKLLTPNQKIVPFNHYMRMFNKPSKYRSIFDLADWVNNTELERKRLWLY